MPEKQKKTIRELTLMLMYLTSWEERDTPEMRAVKKKELEKYPLVRRCWKGFVYILVADRYGFLSDIQQKTQRKTICC